MAKAFADAVGDEQKARALYITYRVRDLEESLKARAHTEKATAKAQAQSKRRDKWDRDLDRRQANLIGANERKVAKENYDAVVAIFLIGIAIVAVVGALTFLNSP